MYSDSGAANSKPCEKGKGGISVMKHLTLTDRKGHIVVEDPPLAQLLFSSTRMAWVWLVIRVWVGFQWLNSSLGITYNLGFGGKQGKLFDPAWNASGEGIRAYWERAVVIPQQGSAPIAFDWYREFLSFLLANNADVWFSKVIMMGELLVGLGLVLGALTGIAAFGGGLMNWSFLMAGTVSTNPLLFALTGLLILAWKNAGYYGLDRYLLPMLGTPWKQSKTVQAPTERPPAARPRVAYKAG
jgi:thiosulfate dehydrogenase [quinone] large subunit